ncbi:pyridoxal phosphate-dependent aminotransferase [Verrucomicrobiota bacterium]|nr:putative pyridoxal phosphate-dependent aminotransferase EpsN [Verrucomicrobiota bacterium]GDY17050.1 pyridoxal phosphate-dependent aminotransferase [Verrucomicrobiota bacterium]
MSRIYLSPPDVGTAEVEFVLEAFEANWVAPVGPHLNAFEQEFAGMVGAAHAVALSSGTAALHLALRLAGVGPGDEVLCSDLTFIASAAPITYLGARPVFIDAEEQSWNMDPAVACAVLEEKARAGRPPKALVLVHLYGQSADLAPIKACCDRHGVKLIEDAAEALGATYGELSPGSLGWAGIHSFNGNKIITTSGGGMLVTAEATVATEARFLATQARDAAPHYQHSTIGYNYRLSNICAGIGRGQLLRLATKVTRRRAHFRAYHQALGDLPGVVFQPEAPWGQSTRWLTCLTIDPARAGRTREDVRLALAAADIESRPLWKPLHLQPVFTAAEYHGTGVGERLFADGLCLPSGSGMTEEQRQRVITAFRSAFGA